LAFALDALSGVDGVGIIRMGQADVMRHKLVKKIIVAMDNAESEKDKKQDSSQD
jgi:phosphate starvation-inducible PhoH-like protein